MTSSLPVHPPEPPRASPATVWALRAVLFTVVLAACALAFALGPFLETRVAQDRAARSLREHRPLEAFEQADRQLIKAPEDIHLRELAVGAADAYFESLVKAGQRTEARDWLRAQLAAKPYLRPLASRLVGP